MTAHDQAESPWKTTGIARELVVLPIRAYKRFVSPLVPPACRFHPTCSIYAMTAIRRHGVARGAYLAARRILRCHPLCEGGHDPVPEAIERG